MCKKAREAINNEGAKFMATFPGNTAKVILNWVTVNDVIDAPASTVIFRELL